MVSAEIWRELNELSGRTSEPKWLCGLLVQYFRVLFALGAATDSSFRDQLEKLANQIRERLGYEGHRDPAYERFKDFVTQAEALNPGQRLDLLDELTRRAGDEPSPRMAVCRAS